MVILVIIRATGRVTTVLKKCLEAIPGKYSIDPLQKTALLGTSHAKQIVLHSESSSLTGGDRLSFKRSTSEKEL
jgi:hypothetical protein